MRADLIYADASTQRFQSKLHFPLSGPYRLLLAAARHYAQYVKISTPYTRRSTKREGKRERERKAERTGGREGKRRGSLRAHENCMENKLHGQREHSCERIIRAMALAQYASVLHT